MTEETATAGNSELPEKTAEPSQEVEDWRIQAEVFKSQGWCLLPTTAPFVYSPILGLMYKSLSICYCQFASKVRGETAIDTDTVCSFVIVISMCKYTLRSSDRHPWLS